MNSWNGIGRLTKKVELKSTSDGTKVVSFTLAVNREFKNSDGNYDADFIPCVAWRNTAELLDKYTDKGHQIGCQGRIQTRTYETDSGETRYVQEVVVDKVDLLEKKEERKTYGADPVHGQERVTPASEDLPF